MAIKRARRQRVRDEILQSTLTESVTHRDKTYWVRAGVDRTRNGRSGWTLQARKCDVCGRIVSLTKHGLLRSHNVKPFTLCNGAPVPEAEDIERAHGRALRIEESRERIRKAAKKDLKWAHFRVG